MIGPIPTECYSLTQAAAYIAQPIVPPYDIK